MYSKKYNNDACNTGYNMAKYANSRKNTKSSGPVKAAYYEKIDKVEEDKLYRYTPNNVMIMGSIPEKKLNEAKAIVVATIRRIGETFRFPETPYYINTIRKNDGTYAITLFIKDKRYVNLFLNRTPEGNTLVEYVSKAVDAQVEANRISRLAAQMIAARNGVSTNSENISWYDMWTDIIEIVPAEPYPHYVDLIKHEMLGKPSLFGFKAQKDANYNTLNFYTNYKLTEDEMMFFHDVTRVGYPHVETFDVTNPVGRYQYVLKYPENTTDGLNAFVFKKSFEIVRGGKTIRLFLNTSK